MKRSKCTPCGQESLPLLALGREDSDVLERVATPVLVLVVEKFHFARVQEFSDRLEVWLIGCWELAEGNPGTRCVPGPGRTKKPRRAGKYGVG